MRAGLSIERAQDPGRPLSMITCLPLSCLLLSDWKVEDGGWGCIDNLLVFGMLFVRANCVRICWSQCLLCSDTELYPEWEQWYCMWYWVYTINARKPGFSLRCKQHLSHRPGYTQYCTHISTQRHKNIQECFLWGVLQFLQWGVTHVC